MKECMKKSQYSNLYMTYHYTVRCREDFFTILIAEDIDQVRAAWKFLKRKYPVSHVVVHRYMVVDDVDGQMRKGA